MMILDSRLDRRDFLVLSGSAAALLVATSYGCGRYPTRRLPEPELLPYTGFGDHLALSPKCRCPQCIRRVMSGPWQMPVEKTVSEKGIETPGAFWDHLKHEYECRHDNLQGDLTWH
jgi:hypothetical protein